MRNINLPSHSATAMLMLAVILLAGNTTALATAQSGSRSQLQSLVTDTAYQLELSYRFNVTELEKRRDEVSRAIEAWNKSPRSEKENQQLADWLRSAIRASMPGSRAELPSLPEFASQRKAESLPSPVAQEHTETNEATAGSSTTESPGTPVDSKPVETGTATAAQAPTATKHTLLRPVSASSETESSASAQTPSQSSAPEAQAEQSTNNSDNSEDITDDSFWKEHPASEALPADLMNGDPFRDDPLPTGDDLFDD